MLILLFQTAPAGFDLPLVTALTAFIALPVLCVKAFLASDNVGDELERDIKPFGISALGYPVSYALPDLLHVRYGELVRRMALVGCRTVFPKHVLNVHFLGANK